MVKMSPMLVRMLQVVGPVVRVYTARDNSSKDEPVVWTDVAVQDGHHELAPSLRLAYQQYRSAVVSFWSCSGDFETKSSPIRNSKEVPSSDNMRYLFK